MRVAFVHDWLVSYRGGEKVLRALLDLYPEAPIYTLFYSPSAMPAAIRERRVLTPHWVSRLVPLRKALLPLLPRAIESFDLSAYDLVISTSSCVAKGVLTSPSAKHLCYLHSPMRYIWDQQESYLAGVAHLPGAQAAIKALTPALQRWDVASTARVDRLIANSTFVAARARRLYGREASVVHPPIELERFRPRSPVSHRSGFLLAAGALVSYKRFDLAIRAAKLLGRRLVIAGNGPCLSSLQALASEEPGGDIHFYTSPSDETMADLLAGAEALLFPGVEDFGMIAVEAMASGTPVIALRDGGAKDIVIEGETGLFFDEPTPQALFEAVRRFWPEDFDCKRIAAHAARFSLTAFHDCMRAEIAAVLAAPRRVTTATGATIAAAAPATEAP